MEEKIRAILQEDDDAVGDLVDLIREYQAKAWDKGFAQRNGVTPMRIGNGRGTDKANRNPYRAK